MKWILFSVIIVMICESIYCFLRKKRSKVWENTSTGSRAVLNDQPKNCIVMRCTTFANDVIFLTFKLIGYIPSHFVRKLFYRYIFHMTIGKNAVIYYGLEVRSPWNIVIGKNSIIGDHAILDARYGIIIGENVNLSNGVWIWTLQHDVNSTSFGTEGKEGIVSIGNRAWISSRVSVLPGSRIAEGVVIAAGAVCALKETDPYTIYGGVPAKRIARRNNVLNYELTEGHRLFL